MIEQQLNKDETSLIAKLKPRFFVIGSVVEGTRLFCASEADMTVEFQGLHEFALLGDDATALMVNEQDIFLLKDFLKKGSLLFDYPKFLFFFMQSIQSAISILKSDGNFPPTFGPLILDHHQCNICKNENEYEPMTHSENCLPTVCHTRIGTCLILPWKFDDSHGWTMTADLVPVFAIKGQTMELVNNVMRTLLAKNPHGWRDYLASVYERDIFLPEGFLLESGEVRNPIQNINIKLLNYNDENNQIIRPGQRMNVYKLRGIDLQQAYVHIKALKTVLEASAKSYMVKKVLLQLEFLMTATVEVLDLEKQDTKWQEIVFEVLHHPDLKKHFEKKIDYSKWSREKCWEIPLKFTTFFNDFPLQDV